MYMKLYKRSQNLNSPSYHITYKIILRVFHLKFGIVKNFLKATAIPLQAWTGPEGFRSLMLTDFKTIGTRKW
jgi:hypothetical protein